MNNKIRLAIILSGGFLFVADRIFKVLSSSVWPQPNLVNRFLGWLPFSNIGIAFGIPIPNWLILLFTIPLIVLVVYLMKKNSGFVRWGLFLVLLGALSNFFDRLYYGHTLDYILVLTSIFNIADVLIVLGASICLIYHKKIRSNDNKIFNEKNGV